MRQEVVYQVKRKMTQILSQSVTDHKRSFAVHSGISQY